MSTKKNYIVQLFSGDALKSARKGLGLSQDEFAEPLGLTGGYISKLEKNERMPKETVVQSIMAVHKIRRDWLEGNNVSEPLTPYQKIEDERPTDEVEKMVLRKMRKRGKSYMFKWLAEQEAEEEAELKNNPAS